MASSGGRHLASCMAKLAAAAALLVATARSEAAEEHYWPRARGHHGRYFLTEETLPRNLSSAFAWKFHHPEGRFRTVMRGNPLIDSKKNVFISTENGLFKLSSEGEWLWYYTVPTTAHMNIVPCMEGDAIFGMARDSTTYSIDLETGKERWRVKYAEHVGGDTGYVEAHKGILITPVDNSFKHDGGNLRLLGLNTSTGSKLWELKLDLPTWNFTPLFPGDGSFIFMDVSGGVYKVMYRDGKRVWHTKPPAWFEHSFTDGGVSLSPDGSMAFACSNNHFDTEGALRAYRTSDGARLWDKMLPTGCTSWPVIAKTGDWGVLPAGHFVNKPLILLLPKWMPGTVQAWLHRFSLYMGPDLRKLPLFNIVIRSVHTELISFDTKTGATKWSFRTPDWQRLAAKGDEEGLFERVWAGRSAICLPTTWGTPTMSGDETVYVGHVSGILYAVKDHDGDGQIDPETEVSTFDMDAAPLPNNPAWAPGMMAVASCDTMFVFKS